MRILNCYFYINIVSIESLSSSVFKFEKNFLKPDAGQTAPLYAYQLQIGKEGLRWCYNDNFQYDTMCVTGSK